jgi:hypothetical protein
LHEIADASDVEDDEVLAIAVDETSELADHALVPAARSSPSPTIHSGFRGREAS